MNIQQLKDDAYNDMLENLNYYVSIRDLDEQIKDMIVESVEITIENIFKSFDPFLKEHYPEEFV